MFERVGRSLGHWLLRAIDRLVFGSSQEWASVVLVFVTLAVAVWSIEAARWIQPLPSLILALGVAVLVCLFLVKSRMPGWVTYSLMVVLGLAVTVWQSTGLFTSTEDKSAFQSWWEVVSAGQLSEGTVYFAMFLLFVTWLIGFVSVWFILRRRNVWVAVFLGTITIFINLSNLPHDYYYFFPIYLLAAVVLIGQVNLTRHDDWFRKKGINYPYRGITYFVAVVFCISVLTVGTAWFVPEAPVERIGLVSMSGAPLGTNAEEHWFNIFAAVRSKWALIESSDQETLSFQDPIVSGSRVLFVITSERSGYWRTRRYDTYHSWGWTNSGASDRTLDSGVMASEVEELPESEVLTYTVESKVNTDVLLTGGEFVSADIPVLLEAFSANETAENLVTPSTSQPTTGEADGIGGRGEDIIAVVSPQLLRPYQHYTMVTTITSVSPDELAEAGEDYDPWIAERYLQLPESFPERVRQLSREITEGAETPYDKAIAIREFLNGFEYDLEAEAPPEELDGVDCFLFGDGKGACVSFASAMVVMLRSVDVPARLSIGYLRGELDEDTGNFIIRGRNYHAWAEVYFPGYGWIEFETTPSEEGGGEIAGTSAGEAFAGGEELPSWMVEPEPFVPGSDLSSTAVMRQWGLRWYVYLAIIAVLLFLVFIVRFELERWLQRLKQVERAFEAYDRMCLLASWGKSGPRVGETPLEYGARLALALPEQAEEIGDITQYYMDVQYGPRKELGKVEKARMQKSWVKLCPFLAKSLLRLRRQSG